MTQKELEKRVTIKPTCQLGIVQVEIQYRGKKYNCICERLDYITCSTKKQKLEAYYDYCKCCNNLGEYNQKEENFNQID